MNDRKETSLSWDDFVKLGNPDNAPDITDDEGDNANIARKSMKVRLHLEKKGRGGKEATIIRGIEENDEKLKELSKILKTKLGVGGSTKDGEIIIQGGQRDKLMAALKEMGFSDIKNSGG